VENVIFAIVLTVAVITFTLSAWRLARLIRLGKPDARLRGELTRRLVTMLTFAFGQKRVVSERFGWNHFLLFWGFMVLFLANAEFVSSGLIPAVSFKLLGGFLYALLTLAFDAMSLVVLGCVIVALYRRLVIKPDYIEYNSKDGYFVLSLVGGLMIAFYGMHGAEAAAGHLDGAWMPFTQWLVAPVMGGVFGHGPGLHAAGRIFWWLHAFIFLFFLNYLPYSKHMHILTSIPNCFSRSFDFVTTAPTEQYATGKKYGASLIDDFTWKDLLDFTACTECGRCNKNCPATATGKPLNPRLVIHDGKVNLLANGEKIAQGNRANGLLPLVGETEEVAGTVGEKSLWACTTCGACMQNCPVFIEHVPKIIKMRRHLVENLAKFPPELNVFFDATEQRSNPWGIAPSDRAKWAKGLDIPLLPEGPVDYLFYVGCAGAFDARNKKVATAVVHALKAAGVKFGILGIEEKCCGDSNRRLGNEFVFARMAKENVELFKKHNVTKIIAYCPHCYSTLKNDYQQFGLNAQVFHHTEILLDLIRQGRLKLAGHDGFGRVLIHDSCYLGCYNGIYEQPREIIARATGGKPLEMDRKQEKSFCCGAGGGRMWMEEEPEHRVNINRVREALTKKPDTIAVACPYCMTMFEDGVKDEKVGDKVKVVDIAEIVAAKIQA
jgi:Fe-S oxidoreductase/nitrate reductase gamma subunit